MKKEFTKQEMETYRQHGVEEGFRKGMAVMSIPMVIIIFALIVVINTLIKLI